jgi:hypothetical protein
MALGRFVASQRRRSISRQRRKIAEEFKSKLAAEAIHERQTLSEPAA